MSVVVQRTREQTLFYTVVGATLVASTLLLAMLVAVALSFRDSPKLGRYTNPGVILNRVDGLAEPALRVGEDLQIERERCAEATVIVDITWQWERVDVRPPSHVTGQTQPQIRLEGCERSAHLVRMPPQVTPGLWQVTTVEQVRETDEQKGLHTERFRVVP